jgi:hypothetical protein
LIGSGIVVVGTILCAMLPQHTHVLDVAGACFVVGLGLGLSASPSMVAVQSVVGWDRRGVVTGTNMFCRSLGSAVGAAVFGAIANATLADRFRHPPAALAGQLPKSVDATNLVLGRGASNPAGPSGTARQSEVVAFVRGALYDASHHVFLALVVVGLLVGAALLLMPRHTEQLSFD